MQTWVSDSQLMQLMKLLDENDKEKVGEPEGEMPESRSTLSVQEGVIIREGADDPADNRRPVAEAVSPLRLIVNGEVVDGPVKVNQEDQLGWTAEQRLFRIDISPDKMKVWFRLLPDGRFKIKPADTEPTDRLVLKPAEDIASPLPVPDLQTIHDDIRKMGVVHCDLAEIMRELNSPTYVPVLVGKGQDPVPGKDAALELFFNERIEVAYEEINGVVDFRNHLKIPSVQKGERIARKIPVVSSTPGYNVFGEKVEAPRPKDFIIIGKKDVRVEGTEVYAEHDGRPRVTGEKIKFIDITTSHVIPGDVDLKTGNVVFTGDIHIYGNVLDGMIVEALGNVYVGGNVYRATITATGSIFVKGNTVGSKLYSGHYGVLFNRLFDGATKLNERLTLYRQVSNQLRQLASERGQTTTDLQVHQLLMETKFQDIPDLCRGILGCISNIQSIRKNLMDDLRQKLEKLAKLHHLPLGTVEGFMVELQHLLVETIEKIRRSEEREICTDIQQCHLTDIMSNGDILIRNQGVLQSRLYSKKNIIFYQYDSVCRGSELEADEVISASIVGGVSGGATRLKAGRRITTSLMYEGKVTVGKFTREILDPVENVCFEVRNNRLVAESFPSELREIRHAAQ